MVWIDLPMGLQVAETKGIQMTPEQKRLIEKAMKSITDLAKSNERLAISIEQATKEIAKK